MRVDLRLQIFQLRLLQMVFHQKLPFHHLLFFFHASGCADNILFQTFHHGIKSPCNNPYLIQRIRRRHFYVKVSLSYQIGGFCQICQRFYHSLGNSKQHQNADSHHNCHQHKTGYFQIFQRLSQCLVAGRVVSELLTVQLINISIDIAVKILGAVIKFFIFFYISSPFGRYRLLCQRQIGFRHFSYVPFQKHGRI